MIVQYAGIAVLALVGLAVLLSPEGAARKLGRGSALSPGARAFVRMLGLSAVVGGLGWGGWLSEAGSSKERIEIASAGGQKSTEALLAASSEALASGKSGSGSLGSSGSASAASNSASAVAASASTASAATPIPATPKAGASALPAPAKTAERAASAIPTKTAAGAASAVTSPTPTPNTGGALDAESILANLKAKTTPAPTPSPFGDGLLVAAADGSGAPTFLGAPFDPGPKGIFGTGPSPFGEVKLDKKVLDKVVPPTTPSPIYTPTPSGLPGLGDADKMIKRARVAWDEGRHAESGQLAVEALKVYERILGKNSSQTIKMREKSDAVQKALAAEGTAGTAAPAAVPSAKP